jgi:hypothetical protein
MISPARCGAALIAALIMAGTAHAASVGDCGGDGGSQSKTLSCPVGQYIVGLAVRTDQYLDRVGIRCASIDDTGKRGKLRAFQYAGGTGGIHSQSRTCPGNRAVTTISFDAGSYIDRLSEGSCKARQPQGGFVESLRLIPFTIGGRGGSFCFVQCSDGEAMHRIIVRYGSWIDSIEGFCRP